MAGVWGIYFRSQPLVRAHSRRRDEELRPFVACWGATRTHFHDISPPLFTTLKLFVFHTDYPNQSVAGPVHTGSQVLSPASLEVHPCNLNHQECMKVWDLSLHTGSLVQRSKYDVDAYVATFHHLFYYTQAICISHQLSQSVRGRFTQVPKS